jgi:hypothetical protein
MAKMPCFYTGCPCSYLQYDSPFSLIFSFPLISLLPPRPSFNFLLPFAPPFLLRHSSRSLPSSLPPFFSPLHPFSSSYSSIPPSSLRSVLVYIPRSYLTVLHLLFFLTFRLFSIVVFLFLYYFPSLLFLVPASWLISSGFRSKFFLSCIHILSILAIVCLTSFVSNEKLY